MKRWLVLLGACWAAGVQAKVGPHEVVTQQLPLLKPFTEVVLEGAFVTTLSDGLPQQHISFTGEKNRLEHVEVWSLKNRLYVHDKRPYREGRAPIHLRLEMPTLTALTYRDHADVELTKFSPSHLTIESKGAGHLVSHGPLHLDALKLQGQGDVILEDVEADKLDIEDAQTGSVRLTGHVGLSHLKHTGASHMVIKQLTHQRPLSVEMSGGGSVHLMGSAVYLKTFDYTGYGNVKISNIASRDLTVNTQGGAGQILLDGQKPLKGEVQRKTYLKTLTHHGKSTLVLRDIDSQGLNLTADGEGLVALSSGDIVAHNIAVKGKDTVQMGAVRGKEMGVLVAEKGVLHILGKATFLNAHLKDHGVLDAFYLMAQTLFVKTVDHAQANVRASDTLNASSSDNSDVYYYEQPKTLIPYLKDSGSVLPMFQHAPPYPVNWQYAQSFTLKH